MTKRRADPGPNGNHYNQIHTPLPSLDAAEGYTSKTCAAQVLVGIGSFKFSIKDFRVATIERGTAYRYLVTIEIGLDILEHFVITVDRT